MELPNKPNIQVSHLLFISFLTICTLPGCSRETESPFGSCLNCHDLQMDTSHQMECTICHQGDSEADTEQMAHANLIRQPAHPENMEKNCGSCHVDIVNNVQRSLHLTLRNKINVVRTAYGAEETIEDLTSVPVHEEIETALQLTDDLLRRRCLQCHLYSKGDGYSATVHGTGCAGCHLDYEEGELKNHRFTKFPSDSSCLSCHYGNYVGADYYGYFEHDLNVEYRTPYIPGTDTRPYGVETHQLVPDIHQQHGMVCVDCHRGAELMQGATSSSKVNCRTCHDKERLERNFPGGISKNGEAYTFTSPATGMTHTLPVMDHPAHKEYNGKATCQVCHAQWSFNDTETHLLRSDMDEYDMWYRLTVQGSSEVEKLLEHNLDYDNEELPPAMSDKITGDMRPGVWYKGYLMRRWEGPLLGRDEHNTITVVRPLLNIALSWIDEDENILFDSHKAVSPSSRVRPYTPHTTGAAGLFYEQRIRIFTASENQASQQAKGE